VEEVLDNTAEDAKDEDEDEDEVEVEEEEVANTKLLTRQTCMESKREKPLTNEVAINPATTIPVMSCIFGRIGIWQKKVKKRDLMAMGAYSELSS
jgi:hypothetical protein